MTNEACPQCGAAMGVPDHAVHDSILVHTGDLKQCSRCDYLGALVITVDTPENEELVRQLNEEWEADRERVKAGEEPSKEYIRGFKRNEDREFVCSWWAILGGITAVTFVALLILFG